MGYSVDSFLQILVLFLLSYVVCELHYRAKFFEISQVKIKDSAVDCYHMAFKTPQVRRLQ